MTKIFSVAQLVALSAETGNRGSIILYYQQYCYQKLNFKDITTAIENQQEKLPESWLTGSK